MSKHEHDDAKLSHDTKSTVQNATPAPKPTPTATVVAEPHATATREQKLLLLLTVDWLNNDRTHAREIAQLVADIVATLDPPINIDVPYASQQGAILDCTMGNWDGEPIKYAYEWHTDGIANGVTTAQHTVVEGDVGKGWACVVTATNALGSTRAPMSNTVVVAAAP